MRRRGHSESTKTGPKSVGILEFLPWVTLPVDVLYYVGTVPSSTTGVVKLREALLVIPRLIGHPSAVQYVLVEAWTHQVAFCHCLADGCALTADRRTPW